MKLKIKKGATVQVIAGSDKGKSGKVLEIKTAPLKIKVQGVKVQTHFDKKEGLLKKEGFFDYSNVKLVAASEKVTKKKAKKKASKNA
ncbi:MAG: KOW motif domain-containing protein [Bdellovibrionota bacterium]